MTEPRTTEPEPTADALRTRRSGWQFLHSYRWVGYFVMLLVFAVACVLLSHWQFDRLEEKRAEVARIDRNYAAEPVELSTAAPDRTEFDEDTWKWRPVMLHGHYTGEPVLARNRPGPDGVGSNLIQAFEVADGGIVFVDRGWVPVTATDRLPSSLPTAPSDEPMEVIARLRASEQQISGRSADGRTVPSINSAMLAELTDTQDRAYYGLYVQLESESTGSPSGVLPDPPERDEGPHLSYALQWVTFILIAGCGVWYAARQEYRNLNPDDERMAQRDLRKLERKRRRGPSDADEEDALLDG